MSEDAELAVLVEWLERGISMLEKVPLDRFGFKRAREDLRRLKRILDEPRNPAFLIVGRSGSGKSSLINAVMGAYVAEVSSVTAGTGLASEVSWHTYKVPGDISRGFDILDTRGAGDMKELHAGAAGDPLEAIDAQLQRTQTDAVLFVTAAANLRENMPRDCKFLSDVLAILEDRFHIRPPVVPVLNQIDQLFSPGTDLNKLGEFERATLDEALAFYREIMARGKVSGTGRVVSDPVPVSSYLRFQKEKDSTGTFRVVMPGRIVEDGRWNIDVLKGVLIGMLPMDAAIGAARVGQIVEVQRTLIARIRTAVATAAAGVAVLPLPMADAPLLIGLHTILVVAISQVAGKRPTPERIREFFGALGMSALSGWGLRELARQAAKLVPGYGALASPPIAFGATWAIGRAAEAWFLDEVSPEEARRIFEQARSVDPTTLPDYQASQKEQGG